MKTTYIATAPNGKQITRTTERTYTHAVLSRTDWAFRRNEAANPDKAIVKNDRANFAYYTRELGPDNRWNPSEEQKAKFRVAIGDCLTADDYVAKCRAERMAYVEADYAARGDDNWGLVGFCGRLDLAQKLAAKGLYGEKDLTIVPAIPK